MASSKIRTKDELARAQWAEKYLSVADGRQYAKQNSPFPLQAYFQNKLIGTKMLEVNAGLCIVENMTADTLTDLQIGDEKAEALVKEFRQWQEDTEYFDGLEEAVRAWFGVGYGVRQPFRTVEGKENRMKVVTLDPSTWYPDIPALIQQDVTSGRVISVFDNGKDGMSEWYALEERHTVGQVAYKLFKLENANSLEGESVELSKVPDLDGLENADTDLDYLAIFQRNRKKSSRYVFGRSVLADVWDYLQEVTENQTRIRHECIKHYKAKLYADIASLQRSPVSPGAADKDPNQMNSKELARAQGNSQASQDILPVTSGSVIPGYIMRDLQFIEKGSIEIDKQLSRIASIVGCPKSIFNLEEKGGNVKVDTEKRKDRRYVRQILQAQQQAAGWVRDDFYTWCKWVRKLEAPEVSFKFTSPFAMSQQETVEIMREMNSDAKFVSREEAIKQIFPEKKPDEIKAMIAAIDKDTEAEMPDLSATSRIPAVKV